MSTRFLNCPDQLVIGNVGNSLPRHSSVLSISAPEDFGRFFLGAHSDLFALDALSEDILIENPAVAREQGGKSGVMVLSRNSGSGYIGFHRRLGTHRIAIADVEVGYCSLGDLLDRFRKLGLVHLGASDGHCGLLLSALPQLATHQPLIWLELPRRGGAAQAKQLQEAFSAEKFEIFAIARARVVETGVGAAAASPLDGEGIASLVLVPHTHPNRAGFDLLAKARTEEARREALALIGARAEAEQTKVQ